MLILNSNAPVDSAAWRQKRLNIFIVLIQFLGDRFQKRGGFYQITRAFSQLMSANEADASMFSGKIRYSFCPLNPESKNSA